MLNVRNTGDQSYPVEVLVLLPKDWKNLGLGFYYGDDGFLIRIRAMHLLPNQLDQIILKIGEMYSFLCMQTTLEQHGIFAIDGTKELQHGEIWIALPVIINYKDLPEVIRCRENENQKK